MGVTAWALHVYFLWNSQYRRPAGTPTHTEAAKARQTLIQVSFILSKFSVATFANPTPTSAMIERRPNSQGFQVPRVTNHCNCTSIVGRSETGVVVETGEDVALGTDSQAGGAVAEVSVVVPPV